MGTLLSRRRVPAEEYRALRELARSATATAARARIVLSVLDGSRPALLARQSGVPRTTIYSWVRRFLAVGVAGLDARSRDEHGLEHRYEDDRPSRRDAPRHTGR